MFTGIVQSQAEVIAIIRKNNAISLRADKSFISFDVIDETLRVSNLAGIEVGSLVNVERSLKVGDEIGGHMLSGHVHTQALLAKRIESEDNCTLCFDLATQYQKYIFAKGFISINGISLTLGAEVGEQFSVHLIPETLSRTNLQHLALGDKVNIEFDQQTMTIVQTIERMNLRAY